MLDRAALVGDFIEAYARDDVGTCAELLDTLFPEPDFPSDGPRVARWLALYVVQTKGRFARLPLLLEEWQYEFVCELYRLDPDTGSRVYTEAFLLLPRKNGKSTLASGLALYHLVADYEASPEVYVAAGSRDQAGVIFRQAKDTIAQSPARLRDRVTAFQHHIAAPWCAGLLKVIPADAKLQHGTNPSASLVDEKWGHRTNDLYAALTTGTDAREEPLTVTISTFGDDVDDSPLGRDYRSMLGIGQDEDGKDYEPLPELEHRTDPHYLTVGRDRENGTLLWSYAPPHDENFEPTVDLEDPEVWAKVNPASWITTEALTKARRKRTTRLVDFRRFRLNVWVQDADYWLPQGTWEELAVDGFAIPEAAPGEPRPKVYLGVDIGQERDRAAVVAVWDTGERVRERDEDGDEIPGGELLPVWGADAAIFEPPVSIGSVRSLIREMAKRYDVRSVGYDPWRFPESAETLADEGLPMTEVAQTHERMCPASQDAFEAIMEARIRHNGDPTFAAHVKAGATTDTGERGWRLTKKKATKPVDALIAFVMALSEAIAGTNNGSAYEDKEMLVL